ncbi:hypothetical protein WOLCODRAFT_152056 [Wolfiporia cocos MD-104 SS10]|uniref:Uncharacterized protein n=1 Tax=Wolfiporia cocos (strain MD-104) TaxID=742152 RepID=A0A2H3JJH3_WOLCO|nr:hypothetical protein WOLCODRAFT_152056 [Wolfiporia cocos MD-104 SS10]
MHARDTPCCETEAAERGELKSPAVRARPLIRQPPGGQKPGGRRQTAHVQASEPRTPRPTRPRAAHGAEACGGKREAGSGKRGRTRRGSSMHRSSPEPGSGFWRARTRSGLVSVFRIQIFTVQMLRYQARVRARVRSGPPDGCAYRGPAWAAASLAWAAMVAAADAMWRVCRAADECGPVGVRGRAETSPHCPWGAWRTPVSSDALARCTDFSDARVPAKWKLREKVWLQFIVASCIAHRARVRARVEARFFSRSRACGRGCGGMLKGRQLRKKGERRRKRDVLRNPTLVCSAGYDTRCLRLPAAPLERSLQSPRGKRIFVSGPGLLAECTRSRCVRVRPQMCALRRSATPRPRISNVRNKICLACAAPDLGYGAICPAGRSVGDAPLYTTRPQPPRDLHDIESSAGIRQNAQIRRRHPRKRSTLNSDVHSQSRAANRSLRHRLPLVPDDRWRLIERQLALIMLLISSQQRLMSFHLLRKQPWCIVHYAELPQNEDPTDRDGLLPSMIQLDL